MWTLIFVGFFGTHAASLVSVTARFGTLDQCQRAEKVLIQSVAPDGRVRMSGCFPSASYNRAR
jgi:hypothetical protein